MDQIKQILNAVNLALFDRSVLPCSEEKDLSRLYSISKEQNITGLVWQGLKSADKELKDTAGFVRHAAMCTYQYACQSAALEHITHEMTQRGYAYILLKGSRMRQFYPEPHLRTSCDIDILTVQKDDEIIEMMTSLGYQVSADCGTTLNFSKPPAVEIEMHRRLFDEGLEYAAYFNHLWERSIPGADGTTERLLTEEDFYAFMIAHAAKHFARYGCGARPIIDIYLYLRKCPAEFDHAKARKILKKLNLLPFEERICALAEAWFESGKLSKSDETLTKFIFNTGIFGDQSITNAQRIRKNGSYKTGKRKLLFSHVFPSYRVMKPMYPRLLKCPVFLPIAWVLRWFRLLFRGRKQTASVLNSLNSMDDAYFGTLDEVMNELQL